MKVARMILGGLAGGFLLTAPPLTAQLIPPPVVNPATYVSRSGASVPEIDPSEMHGQGAATYRLTHEGRDVWSGERPFTLLGACVGDDGVVEGYAYGGGLRGFAKDDKLHLVILDPTGATRLDDVIPRQMSRGWRPGAERGRHRLRPRP